MRKGAITKEEKIMYIFELLKNSDQGVSLKELSELLHNKDKKYTKMALNLIRIIKYIQSQPILELHHPNVAKQFDSGDKIIKLRIEEPEKICTNCAIKDLRLTDSEKFISANGLTKEYID